VLKRYPTDARPSQDPVSRPRVLIAIAAILVLALIVALATAGGDEGTRASAQPGVGSGDGGVVLSPIGEFESPTYVENAQGYRRLLFVVEQPGAIRVLRKGKTLARPFLDISDQVASQGEEGLLSVAFAPDYKKTRRFYVYYTNPDLRIDEFKRRRGSPTQANPNSQRNVLTIPHRDFGNHNGGQLQFGPDGELWLATGDGGGGGDSLDNARNVNTLLGKLLRIDPTSKKGPYAIPKDNPFVGRDGADEVYAYGLRNPWRFSFDAATGDLAIADVGQDLVEEVDYLTRAAARGANFGWPQFEGSQVFDNSRPGPDPPTPPIFTYSSAGGSGNCSITGGYVVRDKSLPTLFGRYVYADLCAGQIRSFVPSASGASDDKPLDLSVASPTSFGEGVGGRIYVTSLDGPVFQLVAG
jgi:glucose/arabinose dehydrogenase